MSKHNLPSDADLQKFSRFLESIDTYSYLNKTDEFYGKIERRITGTKDYTHPAIDTPKSPEAKGAKYECMQIRDEEISGDKKEEKYHSINNLGIMKPGIILKRFDPDPAAPHIEGDVYDSNTRVLKGRAVEKDNPKRAKLLIKQGFVTDRDLCEWLLMHADFFQNGANDHLPAANASDADIKAAIRRQVKKAPPAVKDAPEFKDELKRRMCAVASHRPRATIGRWVNAEYNSRKAAGNGIHRYHDKHDRQRAIRTALEKQHGLDPEGWISDCNSTHGLNHRDCKIYAVSSATASLEKACGLEDYRLGKNKDSRPSVCLVYNSGATTAKSLREAQGAVFKKIDIISTTKKRTKCFDVVFVLGQEHSVDIGTLLTKKEVVPLTTTATPKLKIVNG